MNEYGKRDRVLTLMRCWAIFIPSLFFSYATDTIHIAVLCIIASVMNLFRDEGLKITLRTIIYSIVLSLTIIVITNTLFKIENRFYLTPSEMGVPTALVFAMALLYYDDRSSFSASILILVIFAIMMCGDITNSHIVKNLPIPASLGKMEAVKSIYIISLLLCVFPFFYLMNRSQNSLKIMKGGSVKLRVIKYALALGCFALVFAFYSPTQRVVVPFTKDLESRMVRTLSQWRFNKKKTAFEKQIDLRDSYFNIDADAHDTILIRVESDRTPGYIRSRVYEAYKDGVWGSNDKPELMELLNENHEYSFNAYSFKGLEQVKREELNKLQIYYSGNFRAENVLHQGKSTYIEMTCDTLNQSQSGTVSGKDVDFSGGITLYNDKNWSSEDAFNAPKVTQQNQSMFSTNDLVDKARMNRFVKQLDTLNYDGMDPKDFAHKVAKFFHDNFTYKLGVKLDRSKDLVYAFLEQPDTERAGHCEYFATAAVMMLRSQDIPARYVTGFYCQEQHPNGDYYLGRSKDLHAWVEFYDHNTESWYLLEPTPPSGMPNGSSQFNFLSYNWDAFTKRWQDLLSNIVRGYFAESIILFLKGAWDIVVWCFSSIPKAIISSLLIILWLRKRRKKVEQLPLGKEVEVIHKDIQKLLNKISKIKGFTLNESMTIREIMAQLKSKGQSQLDSYITCLEEYESLRYNSKLRTTESINEMRDKISQTLKSRIR
ncbi:MAG: transglutaminase-like domain-containing protein [Lentisphaeraceae bacterium]|nr:transglutaminase-like domain-containing protein [Lentisphaeraceae bacterium]